MSMREENKKAIEEENKKVNDELFRKMEVVMSGRKKPITRLREFKKTGCWWRFGDKGEFDRRNDPERYERVKNLERAFGINGNTPFEELDDMRHFVMVSPLSSEEKEAIERDMLWIERLYEASGTLHEFGGLK